HDRRQQQVAPGGSHQGIRGSVDVILARAGWLSSNRHPALAYRWSMIFSENGTHPRLREGGLFRNHALTHDGAAGAARRTSAPPYRRDRSTGGENAATKQRERTMSGTMRDKQWHLDRNVPLALIATIIGQTMVAAWGASNLWARVGELERR